MKKILYNRENGTVIISTSETVDGFEVIGWCEDALESTERPLRGSERRDNIGIVSVYPPK